MNNDNQLLNIEKERLELEKERDKNTHKRFIQGTVVTLVVYFLQEMSNQKQTQMIIDSSEIQMAGKLVINNGNTFKEKVSFIEKIREWEIFSEKTNQYLDKRRKKFLLLSQDKNNISIVIKSLTKEVQEKKKEINTIKKGSKEVNKLVDENFKNTPIPNGIVLQDQSYSRTTIELTIENEGQLSKELNQAKKELGILERKIKQEEEKLKEFEKYELRFFIN